MITRFRVEGVNQDEGALRDELALSSSRIIAAIREIDEVEEVDRPDGYWECTDEYISDRRMADGMLHGRQVMLFQRED